MQDSHAVSQTVQYLSFRDLILVVCNTNENPNHLDLCSLCLSRCCLTLSQFRSTSRGFHHVIPQPFLFVRNQVFPSILNLCWLLNTSTFTYTVILLNLRYALGLFPFGLRIPQLSVFSHEAPKTAHFSAQNLSFSTQVSTGYPSYPKKFSVLEMLASWPKARTASTTSGREKSRPVP